MANMRRYFADGRIYLTWHEFAKDVSALKSHQAVRAAIDHASWASAS
jgi:hypothetical protein